jgi:RNA polymerase sigma-70 factor (ECF subfamily)
MGMFGDQSQHVLARAKAGTRFPACESAVILTFPRPGREAAETMTASPVQASTGADNNKDFAPLIARISEQRDREAFVEVFRYFAPRVKSFLINRGRNQQSAEDVLQEVMIAVWEKAYLYNSEKASVSTWLFTIARYKHIDRIRRDGRHKTESDEPDLRPSEEPEADAEVLQSQRAEAVRKVVATLPQDQQTVIAMSFNQGLSHSEIAEQLGLPLGTVKSRIRRAFQRMREELGELK